MATGAHGGRRGPGADAIPALYAPRECQGVLLPAAGACISKDSFAAGGCGTLMAISRRH